MTKNAIELAAQEIAQINGGTGQCYERPLSREDAMKEAAKNVTASAVTPAVATVTTVFGSGG